MNHKKEHETIYNNETIERDTSKIMLLWKGQCDTLM
jgi:hypothetical protein